MKAPEVLPLPRLGACLGVAAAALAVGALAAPWAPVGLLLLLAVLAVAAVDLALCARPGQLSIERVAPAVLSHGAANRVLLRIVNRGARPALVRIDEVWPPDVAPARVQLAARVPPRQTLELPYEVRPARRGPVAVAATDVRARGPLGLFARQAARAIAGETLRVYPDVAGIGRFELAARRQRMAEVGVRAIRALGAGTEIEGLRDYVPDDEFRRIDWKATARRGVPVTRDLRADTSQQVILLLDAGRLGGVEMGGGARRIDHAVNAAMLLAHVAAVRGDRVGVLVFDRQVRRWAPPRRASRAVVPALARALYDVEAVPVESDFDLAFRTLAARDRRRSLLVLFSDVLSPAASTATIAHMAASRRRHIPLCVAIGDPALTEAAARPAPGAPEHEPARLRRFAAAQLREEREEALRAMRRRGVLVVDAAPALLAPTLINRYLELKARRLL